jgi:hypothetical protein
MEKQYSKVIWKDNDGRILKEKEFVDNIDVSFDDVFIKSKSDLDFIYIFKYWEKQDSDLDNNLIYSAIYEKTPNNLIISEYYSSGYMVKGYLGNPKKIIIPSLFLDKRILVIDIGAFSNCNSLRQLVISEGIIYILMGAFKSCLHLKSITLPKSINLIEDSSFSECVSLKEINFPSNDSYNLLKMGNGVVLTTSKNWDNDSKAVGSIAYGDIVINSGIFKISEDAFLGCSGIKSFTFPNSLNKVEENAFLGCSGIENIIINKLNTNFHLLHLGNGKVLTKSNSWNNQSKAILAFGDIIIPPNITNISDYAFSGLSSIKSILFPNTIKKIGSHAFTGVNFIKQINLPESIIELGGFCFASCSRLKSINIPNNIKLIDSYAFSGCTSLTKIILHENIITLGTGVFSNTPNLHIYCKNKYPNPNWNSYWDYQTNHITFNYKKQK